MVVHPPIHTVLLPLLPFVATMRKTTAMYENTILLYNVTLQVDIIIYFELK